MTVGELRKALEGVADDAVVIVLDQDGDPDIAVKTETIPSKELNVVSYENISMGTIFLYIGTKDDR